MWQALYTVCWGIFGIVAAIGCVQNLVKWSFYLSLVVGWCPMFWLASLASQANGRRDDASCFAADSVGSHRLRCKLAGMLVGWLGDSKKPPVCVCRKVFNFILPYICTLPTGATYLPTYPNLTTHPQISDLQSTHTLQRQVCGQQPLEFCLVSTLVGMVN